MTDDASPEPGPGTLRTGPRGLPAVTFRWWEAIVAYLFGNLFVGVLIFSAFGATRPGAAPIREVLGALVVDVAFVATLWLWFRNVHPGSWSAIGPRARGVSIAAGVGAGLAVYAVAWGVAAGLQWLFERATGRPVEPPEQMPAGLSDAGTLLFVLVAVVFAPVVEELFFRGVLYRSIRDRYGIVLGVLCSSLLFGLVHAQPGPLETSLLLQAVMVVTGAALAMIYELGGTLYASIAAHAAFNVVGVIVILAERP